MTIPQGPYFPHPDNKADGVDVAIYQDGKVDSQRMRENGNVRFAYIKCSEATFQDSAFERHVANFRKTDILLGAYHFFRNNVDPIKQAEKIASLYPQASDLPAMLDVEDPYFDFKNPPPWSTILERSKPIEQAAHACATEIERLTQRRCVIYTGGYYFAHRTSDLALNRPLFVAQYLKSGTRTPTIPIAWNKWDIWQWAGDDGRVEGVSIACDRNYFNGDVVALQNWSDASHLTSAKDVPTFDPANTESGTAWILYRNTENVGNDREDLCDEEETFMAECFNFGMRRAA